MVVAYQRENIDWDELDRWAIREGIVTDREIIDIYRKTKRSLP
jgi:hypothetical protein